MQLPLFLLHTVLIPGQRLPLKVFEARYLDMVSACLKQEKPFGVCLIKSGREVGEAGQPHAVGTLATIEQWEMPKPGVLHILVRGGERFRIRSHTQHGELVTAEVELWEPEPVLEIPQRYAGLVEFLRQVIRPEPGGRGEEFDNASWVGLRLSELLPVTNETKQRWLEQRDPVARLGDILLELERLAQEQSQ